MDLAGTGELVEVLRKVAERYPEIRLLYLFGSYAEDRAMPASDIDIAFAASRYSVIPHFIADVAKELRISEEKISVLDLESALPSLVASILKRGVKVVDRGGVVEKLLGRVGLEVLELGGLSEIHFAKWVEGNPLDPRVIGRILSQV